VKTHWIWAIGGALVVGAALLDPNAGVIAWLELKSDLQVAEGRAHALEQRNLELRARITALETEPFEIERAIREELGLARPGERIVRFPPGPVGADGLDDGTGESGTERRR